MRNLKKLLEILYDKVNNDYSYHGLCSEIAELENLQIITVTEKYELFSYIRKNRPFSAYFRSDLYYWNPRLITPRLDWLKTHINKCSIKENIYILPNKKERARFVDGKWQAERKMKFLDLIPVGWDYYGYEYGDDYILGLDSTPYRFNTKEECINWLNNKT